MTDLLRKYLEAAERIEVGRGKNRHTVLIPRKELLIRSLVTVAAKGSVAGLRLALAYLDGLPTVNIGIEGRLVDLGYDLEQSPEDEAHYAELLGQFFLDPAVLKTQDDFQRKHASLFARLKDLKEAGIDIWSDELLPCRQPPPAGDPDDDAGDVPEAPDPGDGP